MSKSNNDPVLFESPAIETANMSVLHCREVLEKTGLTSEAHRLEGVEVTDQGTAAVALDILNSMRLKAEAEYARQIAVGSVTNALRS